MYSDRPLPDAIAHRGLHITEPENSLGAFAAAVGAGAEGIELDVQASGDGVLFVHHDPALPDSNDSGAMRTFKSMDSSEVAALRLENGAAIPTLDDALDAIAPEVTVYIEVKARGIENDVARCVRRHASSGGRYAVHAFDHRISRRMLEILPSLRTGVLQVSYLVDSRTALRAAGAMDLWQQAAFIDSSLVADIHSYGGSVVAWTSNTDTEWDRLARLGVDAICTDRVDLFLAWRSAVTSGNEPP